MINDQIRLMINKNVPECFTEPSDNVLLNRSRLDPDFDYYKRNKTIGRGVIMESRVETGLYRTYQALSFALTMLWLGLGCVTFV